MYATNHLKDNFPRGQFTGGYCLGAIITGVIVQELSLEVNCLRGNFPRGKLSGRQLTGGQFSSGAVVRTQIIPRLIFRTFFNHFTYIHLSCFRIWYWNWKHNEVWLTFKWLIFLSCFYFLIYHRLWCFFFGCLTNLCWATITKTDIMLIDAMFW